MVKVHVVGAGPAGTISAITAQRSGHDAIVSEDHPVSGIPENCSGLFSVDGLNSLSAYVDYERNIINPIYGANIDLGGSLLTIRKTLPVAYVCDRASLDQQLASNAEAEGVRINYGERINGSFRSETVIGADGPLSFVARHFKFPKITKFASTLQAMVEYSSPDPHMVEIFLSNRLFPGFFGWIIPHDEYTAEFGVGVEYPNRAQHAWRALLHLIGTQSAPKPRGAVIPLHPRARTSLHARGWKVCLVGDAAGQVKSTTGGGVIFGGNCAEIAGRHAINPLRYELEWRLRHGTDLYVHRIIHDYLASLDDNGMASLGRSLKKSNLDVYLSENGHMDRPTRMLRPQLVTHLLRNMVAL